MKLETELTVTDILLYVAAIFALLALLHYGLPNDIKHASQTLAPIQQTGCKK
jgi:hypothetical protein